MHINNTLQHKLEGIPQMLYQLFSENEKILFNKHSNTIKFKKNEYLVRQGLEQSSIYYVLNGYLALEIETIKCNDIVNLIIPNRFAGAMDINNPTVSAFNLRALCNVEAISIPIKIIKSIMGSNSEICLLMFDQLGRAYIRSLHRDLISKESKGVNRIASLLNYFSTNVFDSLKFTIPFTYLEMGNFTGTTDRTVRDAFLELEAEKCIKIIGKTVEILNFQILQKFIEHRHLN